MSERIDYIRPCVCCGSIPCVCWMDESIDDWEEEEEDPEDDDWYFHDPELWEEQP